MGREKAERSEQWAVSSGQFSTQLAAFLPFTAGAFLRHAREQYENEAELRARLSGIHVLQAAQRTNLFSAFGVVRRNSDCGELLPSVPLTIPSICRKT